jgi:hypothetical protein
MSLQAPDDPQHSLDTIHLDTQSLGTHILAGRTGAVRAEVHDYGYWAVDRRQNATNWKNRQLYYLPSSLFHILAIRWVFLIDFLSKFRRISSTF